MIKKPRSLSCGFFYVQIVNFAGYIYSMSTASPRTERFILFLFIAVLLLLGMLFSRVFVSMPDENSQMSYGYIDRNGSACISFEYDSVGDFHLGYATVKKDGKIFVIDTTGKEVARKPFFYRSESTEHKHLVENATPEYVQTLNNSFEILGSARCGNYLVRIQRQHHVAENGSISFDFVYCFIPQFRQESKPVLYDEAYNFSDALALVKTGKSGTSGDIHAVHRYGFIGPDGEFRIRPVYHAAHSFSEGRAAVGILRGFRH
jgi:hypothetical protein